MISEVLDVDLSHWQPGARFFQTSTGEHFVVTVDDAKAPEGSRAKIIRQPSAVIAADAAAVAVSMAPVFVGEAGESAESVLSRFGYPVE